VSVDILKRVRELILDDDSLTDANNCRDTTVKLTKQLKDEFPDANINILVYPEAKEGAGIHYAISTDNQIINPVSAPGFPQYIGPIKNAVPTFALLRKVSGVK